VPIADMRDESTEVDVRVAITLRPGADPLAVQAQLARLDALGADMAAQYPAPLADLLRSWVSTHQDEDITASLNLFEAAVRAGRLGQQADRGDAQRGPDRHDHRRAESCRRAEEDP
jgi:hypothetical protein